MAIFSNLNGTMQKIFKLGKKGATLEYDNNKLSVKNFEETQLIPLSVGEPVASTDATTVNYVGANFSSNNTLSQNTGASLIGTAQGTTVQANLDSKTNIADLASPLATKGDELVAVHQPFAQSNVRSVHAKMAEVPSIYDWDSDSVNDDTMRFTKLIADGIKYIDLPQGTLNISELVIPSAISIRGRGKQGLSGVGTQIIVNPDAEFGMSFDSTGLTRPTGGGISHLSLKTQNRNTGDPDLLKVTSWSYFGVDEVEFANSMGWMIKLKDCMESQIMKFNMRGFGSETTGGILFDDYIGANYNNVNNLHISHGTFGGGSGSWISSTAQSNPDMIWIDHLKFEWDTILSSPNVTNKYVLDFLNMARCWITHNGFTHFADTHNMYQAAVHMGPLCGFSTHFSENQLYGMRSPWLIEGGSFISKNNTSNQADYTSSANMGGIITSNKFCDIEPVLHVTSNGSMTRGKIPKDSGFSTAHELGGNINNSFTVNSSATQSTVMVVAPATQIRQFTVPPSLLDGTSVVNITLRVSCQNTTGANSSVAIISGSTTLASQTVTASKGWQILKFQLKPTQITSSLNFTNTGTAIILFDGVKCERSAYIDWNFALATGTIAAGASFTSPTQSYVDMIGTSGLIQSMSHPKFDATSSGLTVSMNPLDVNGSFTITLTNNTQAAITPSITRCFVRLFLN